MDLRDWTANTVLSLWMSEGGAPFWRGKFRRGSIVVSVPGGEGGTISPLSLFLAFCPVTSYDTFNPIHRELPWKHWHMQTISFYVETSNDNPSHTLLGSHPDRFLRPTFSVSTFISNIYCSFRPDIEYLWIGDYLAAVIGRKREMSKKYHSNFQNGWHLLLRITVGNRAKGF